MECMYFHTSGSLIQNFAYIILKINYMLMCAMCPNEFFLSISVPGNQYGAQVKSLSFCFPAVCSSTCLYVCGGERAGGD